MAYCRRVRRRLESLAVIALVFAVTACDGSPGSHTVGIVGDSITNFSGCTHTGVTTCLTPFTDYMGGSIGDAFEDSYAVFMDAWSGQEIATMEPYVAQLASDGDHVIIVELGTNDAIDGNPNWQADYLQVLSDVADTSCVVLVTAPLFADTLYANANGGDRLDIAAELDALIGLAVDANSNMRLVDYAQHLRDTPDFSADGIHPTSLASQQWVADQYRSAADSCSA